MMKLMKLNRKTYLGLGLLVVLAAAALLFAGGGDGVETVEVERGTITRTVEDAGYVQASTDYDLYAAQGGRVIQVPVKVGQEIAGGQTLVVLENLDLSAQIAQAQSQLDQAGAGVKAAQSALERTRLSLEDARQNLDRAEELFQAGAVTQQEYDQAKLQVETLERSLEEQGSLLESAQAQEAGLRQSLDQLKAMEGQLVLKSPVAGTVLSLPAKKEQVVANGALLAKVGVAEELEVKADILSDDLGEVKEGQRVTVTAPVLGSRTLIGRVQQIYPQAEEKQSALGVIQRRVPVIIALDEAANLKPGYEVRVSIETQSRQGVLLLPREAIRTVDGGSKEVMMVVNRRVRYQPVQTGLSDSTRIEITGGLEEKALVVRDASLSLKEGARVKPLD